MPHGFSTPLPKSSWRAWRCRSRSHDPTAIVTSRLGLTLFGSTTNQVVRREPRPGAASRNAQPARVEHAARSGGGMVDFPALISAAARRVKMAPSTSSPG
jgi:hypothetical protein